MIYIGIDPGLEKSAYVACDHLFKVRGCAILENNYLKMEIPLLYYRFASVFPESPELVIEKPICRKYAGSDVSETAIWAGIFAGRWPIEAGEAIFHGRSAIKGHWGRKGNDSVIRKALIDRFEKDKYKISKSGVYVPIDKDNLGRFTCFTADIWQAFALLVYHVDKKG